MKLKEKINDIYKVAQSPKAYTLYTCIGLIVTIAAAIVETRELCKKEAAKTPEEKSEETKLDRAIELVTAYPVTEASMVVTFRCLGGLNKSWGKIVGQCTNDVIFWQNRARTYRNAAPGLVAAELIHGFSGKQPDEGKEWFCLKDMTPYGDIYFESTQLEVLGAEYQLNKIFADKGTASVREFAILLKIADQIDNQSDCYGWNAETYYEWGDFPWIDFRHNHTVDPETGVTINEIHPIWGPLEEDEVTLAYGYLSYPGEISGRL